LLHEKSRDFSRLFCVDRNNRGLTAAADLRVYPKAIRTDQGSWFSGSVVDRWADKHGVKPKIVISGKVPGQTSKLNQCIPLILCAMFQ